MAFIVAVIILGLISLVWIRFRCYVCFNLLMIGLGMFIAGLIREESLFTTGGVIMFIGGIVIMVVTSLKVDSDRRGAYMLNLFLSGLFSFLHVMFIMMIVLMPLAAVMKEMAADYRECVVVDSMGNKIGTDYVDSSGHSRSGKTYTEYDPYS